RALVPQHHGDDRRRQEDPFGNPRLVGAAVLKMTKEHAMLRRCLSTIVGVVAVAGCLFAQDSAARGTIAKLDIDSKSITLKVGDKERTFRVLDSTRLPDAQGDTIEEKLRSYKVGAAVMFKAA